jgi:hypothetical protein
VKEMQDALNELGQWLGDRDLLDEDNQGTVIPPHEDHALDLTKWGIAAAHPEDGQRIYGYAGPDLVQATRGRADGRLEHSVLDEDGMPIEWRRSPVVVSPDPSAN